jgi:hypothetical protein
MTMTMAFGTYGRTSGEVWWFTDEATALLKAAKATAAADLNNDTKCKEYYTKLKQKIYDGVIVPVYGAMEQQTEAGGDGDAAEGSGASASASASAGGGFDEDGDL